MLRRDFLVRTGMALGASALAGVGRELAQQSGAAAAPAGNGVEDWESVRSSETPYATRYVRVAASVLNTPQEVDAALREIRALG